jgi:hypothetical protein
MNKNDLLDVMLFKNILDEGNKNRELGREISILAIRQAQHHATWAMAIEAAADYLSNTWYGSSTHENCASIRCLPCPPLENKGE